MRPNNATAVKAKQPGLTRTSVRFAAQGKERSSCRALPKAARVISVLREASRALKPRLDLKREPAEPNPPRAATALVSVSPPSKRRPRSLGRVVADPADPSVSSEAEAKAASPPSALPDPIVTPSSAPGLAIQFLRQMSRDPARYADPAGPAFRLPDPRPGATAACDPDPGPGPDPSDPDRRRSRGGEGSCDAAAVGSSSAAVKRRTQGLGAKRKEMGGRSNNKRPPEGATELENACQPPELPHGAKQSCLSWDEVRSSREASKQYGLHSTSLFLFHWIVSV